jgi:acyl-CoA synthetase (AMP-forming)/AMP-acid ligase II
VAAGDHVCLWLGNRPEHVFLFFAISKVGAVLVPINTRFRTRDMAYIVVQSDATTLIAADRAHGVDYLAMLRELDAPLLQRIILLADTPHAGTLDWPELLRAGAGVSDDIQSRWSMRLEKALSSASTKAVICALASGGKYCATYSLPTASPSATEVAVTPRFQRALSSGVPSNTVP